MRNSDSVLESANRQWKSWSLRSAIPVVMDRVSGIVRTSVQELSFANGMAWFNFKL